MNNKKEVKKNIEELIIELFGQDDNNEIMTNHGKELLRGMKKNPIFVDVYNKYKNRNYENK